MKRNALIVEDDKSTFLELSGHLAHHGYTSSTYTPSLNAAITQWETLTYDLILLDIRLSDNSSGLTFAHHVRKSSDVPIIFISSLEDRYTVQQSLAYSTLYLVKSRGNPLEQLNVLLYGLEKHPANSRFTIGPPKQPEPDQRSGIMAVLLGKKRKGRGSGNDFKPAYRIAFNDIVHIGKNQDHKSYCDLNLCSGQTYQMMMRLSDYAALFPASFVRIERRDVVNLHYLEERPSRHRIILAGITYTIGKSYLSGFEDGMNGI